jgi:hypothetical protein
MGTVLCFVNNAKTPNVIMPVPCETQLYVSTKKRGRDILIKISVTAVVIVSKLVLLNPRELILTRKIILPLSATFAGGGQAVPFALKYVTVRR